MQLRKITVSSMHRIIPNFFPELHSEDYRQTKESVMLFLAQKLQPFIKDVRDSCVCRSYVGHYAFFSALGVVNGSRTIIASRFLNFCGCDTIKAARW